MCFRFDSCFGGHVHDDDDPSPAAYKGLQPRHAATTKNPPPPPQPLDGYNNGHHAQQGLDRGNAHYKVAYNDHQPVHANDKAGRGMRSAAPAPAPAPAVAAVGGHGYATGGNAYKTAVDDEAFKAPAAARNNKAAHGADDDYNFRCEGQPDGQETQVPRCY